MIEKLKNLELYKNTTSIDDNEIYQDWQYDQDTTLIVEIIKELEQLAIDSVSKSVAAEYAEFCVRCDRKELPLLCLEDYIKQYCC